LRLCKVNNECSCFARGVDKFFTIRRFYCQQVTPDTNDQPVEGYLVVRSQAETPKRNNHAVAELNKAPYKVRFLEFLTL
jgi:hypothetical protein